MVSQCPAKASIERCASSNLATSAKIMKDCKACREKEATIDIQREEIFELEATIDRLKTAIFPQRLLLPEVRKESYRLNGLFHFGSIKDV